MKSNGNIGDIEKARKIVESSRATHIEWRDWMEANPGEAEELRTTLGDMDFQTRCIEEYDFVISVLDRMKQHQKQD